jgi:uncharacterized membrane protein YqaE (UPF0057 family)
MDVARIIFAFLLPPLGVFLQVGVGPRFWLNILPTILGCVPGIVHAVYIIAKRQVGTRAGRRGAVRVLAGRRSGPDRGHCAVTSRA